MKRLFDMVTNHQLMSFAMILCCFFLMGEFYKSGYQKGQIDTYQTFSQYDSQLQERITSLEHDLQLLRNQNTYSKAVVPAI